MWCEIWGRKLELCGSPVTYLHYRNEFGVDLARDLGEIYAHPDKVDTLAMLKIAWAMNKTAAPEGMPKFEEWLEEFMQCDFSTLSSPVGVIDSAIVAELFRVRKTGTRAQRFRKRLARWLGTLQEHISPQAAGV